MNKKIITQAIAKLQPYFEGKIIKYYKEFLLIAKDEFGIETRKAKIENGQTNGFFTVEQALQTFCNDD